MHTEVDVPNPNELLIPGLYAEATITLEQKANVLAVPLQAVEPQKAIRPPSMWFLRPTRSRSGRVTLGIQTATDAEVISGLQDGEMVVVSDRSGLKAGEEVRPKVIELVEYQGQEDKK